MDPSPEADFTGEPTQLDKKKKYTKLITNRLLISIGIILLLLIIIPVILLLLSSTNKSKQKKGPVTPSTPRIEKIAKETQPIQVKQAPSQILVYGTWTSQSSVIRAINLDTSRTKTLATLPVTIKKVTVLSNNTLLYIDQTDDNDHGQRISVYNLQQKQIVVNIPAASGFGIDDYVLSPNKRYLVLWEVKFSLDTNTLMGGQSRVYGIDLTQPTVSNLLYDETATQTVPIHYPRAVLNDGTVFTDQFIPNDPKGGTGWAYGMSIVDFDGTNKQDIPAMANGTYGSQPILSPDGKYLLFAGYDGSNGDGTAIKNGYRQALLTPNTIELLDTNTLQRYKLPNLPDTNTYTDVQWDKQTGNIIFSQLSSDTRQMGVSLYDVRKLHETQLPLPSANQIPYGYVSQLTDTKTLTGIQSTNAENLGNLGETYSYAYKQLAILDGKGSLTYLSLEDPFIQYITILPGNYFTNILGAQTSPQSTQPPQVSYAFLQANPQNYSFFLKTTLATLRLQGLSSPVKSTNPLLCQNLRNAQCVALGLTPVSKAYKACQNTEKTNNLTLNACY